MVWCFFRTNIYLITSHHLKYSCTVMYKNKKAFRTNFASLSTQVFLLWEYSSLDVRHCSNKPKAMIPRPRFSSTIHFKTGGTTLWLKLFTSRDKLDCLIWNAQKKMFSRIFCTDRACSSKSKILGLKVFRNR